MNIGKTAPQECQIPLTTMPASKLLKSMSNAKVTSNHLFHYDSDVISHGKVLSQGRIIRNIQVIVHADAIQKLQS
jgi:hypothetical protein